MLRTALLGGNSITLDADMSKYIETVSDQGVIEGLEVSSGSVAPGKAWVKATRANGETIMVLVQNTEALSVDTSGTKKIWLEIKQEAIDNGALNNEDGTGIAEIKTGSSVPSQNSLLLASVNNGRVEDARAIIPKIQSVAQRTTSLEQKMETQEQKVERLEEASIPEYLGTTLIVGETYEEGDSMIEKDGKLFKEYVIHPIVSTTNKRYPYGYAEVTRLSPDPTVIWEYVEFDSVQYDNVVTLYLTDRLPASNSQISQVKTYASFYSSSNTKKHQLQGYQGGEIVIGVRNEYGEANLAINGLRLIGRRIGDRRYPRETQGVGEKVVCTLAGLHSDRMPLSTPPIPINKKISGEVSTQREAPSSGLLYYEFTSYVSGDERAKVTINGEEVVQGLRKGTGMMWVRRGQVPIILGSMQYNGKRYASLTLKNLIPL